MSDFEEEYMDVLQNIEAAIVSVYHRESELVDFEVERALNALLVEYRAEQRDRPVPHPALSDLGHRVYEQVKGMCEWRLGRTGLDGQNQDSRMPQPPPLTLDEIIACLKRIRKSVQKWNKRGGQQGYLQFIDQFV
jgi:hypothetical protein